MIDSVEGNFFINVATPAHTEGADISPFPTFDEESLISNYSIETEPDDESPEEEAMSSESESDSDDYDDDDDSSSDSSSDSSVPPLPEDIGYVIDANGVSLLANLNRKLLEHRYGKDYKFDKVPVTTKIDVDEAVSIMEKMKGLLTDGTISREEFDMAVIPKSPSSTSEKNGALSSSSKNETMNKMLENLTKDDLQVLYKAVMGKDMPEVAESREDGETDKRKGGDNPLGEPVPSILEESLSGSTTSADSSFHSAKKKGTTSKTRETAETVPVNTGKAKRGFGFLKKLKFFKKKNAATKSKKDDSNRSTKATKKSKKSTSKKPQPVPEAQPRAANADCEERDAPEPIRAPSPEAELSKASSKKTETSTNIVAYIVDTNDVDAIQKAKSETRESPEEAVVEATEELNVTPGIESKDETAEQSPTIEETILNANSDIVSIVSEVNGNCTEVEVSHNAIDVVELPEAPVCPTTAHEYANALADQGEKKIGRRFSKVLRGKMNKPASPADESADSDSVKLTSENPVIEIPLSEMKPRRSLMEKYAEKKPKISGATSPKAAETTPSPKQKSAGTKAEKVLAYIESDAEKEVHQPTSPKAKSPKVSKTPTKASSGVGVSSKESSKSKTSAKFSKSKKKSDVETPTDEINGFESLRGWKNSDMDSFEEAGDLMCCGMENPAGKNDWFEGIEKSFTQMFDYWDHTPEEAYENSKIYQEKEYDDDDEGSVTSRSPKRSSRSRSKTRRDRSVKSCSDRSVGSRGGSVRSKRRKSRSDKSVRSKSRSDRSVGEKSANRYTKSRSKSVKSSTKVQDVKAANESSFKFATESTKKVNNTTKKGTTSTIGKSAKSKSTRNVNTGGPTLEKLENTTSKSVKVSPAYKAGKGTVKKN